MHKRTQALKALGEANKVRIGRAKLRRVVNRSPTAEADLD